MARKSKTEYAFTLKFKLEGKVLSHDEIMLRLGDAGCTDALAGLGVDGYLSLEFDREAASALDAFLSAIGDVKKALPDSRLVEAGPDFVGLSEIAEVASVSRQNMRKLFLNHSLEFPPPVHGGSATIWHLSPVLEFMASRDYAISPDLQQVARAAMQVNLAKEAELLDRATAGRINHAICA